MSNFSFVVEKKMKKRWYNIKRVKSTFLYSLQGCQSWPNKQLSKFHIVTQLNSTEQSLYSVHVCNQHRHWVLILIFFCVFFFMKICYVVHLLGISVLDQSWSTSPGVSWSKGTEHNWSKLCKKFNILTRKVILQKAIF